MGNHKSLLNTGTGQNSVGLDADYLHATLDIELTAEFGARIGELTSENLDHIDVFFGN